MGDPALDRDHDGDIRALCEEYVAVQAAIIDAKQEVERLESRSLYIESSLGNVMAVDEVVGVRGHLVYWGQPKRRPARRVDMRYAAEVSEVLIDMGIAKQTLAPIKGNDVLSREGALRSAGVDVRRLLPDPPEPRLVLNVEPTG